jgi:hypothetical protein
MRRGSFAWAGGFFCLLGGASWIPPGHKRHRQELHHHVAPLALFAPPRSPTCYMHLRSTPCPPFLPCRRPTPPGLYTQKLHMGKSEGATAPEGRHLAPHNSNPVRFSRGFDLRPCKPVSLLWPCAGSARSENTHTHPHPPTYTHTRARRARARAQYPSRFVLQRKPALRTPIHTHTRTYPPYTNSVHVVGHRPHTHTALACLPGTYLCTRTGWMTGAVCHTVQNTCGQPRVF